MKKQLALLRELQNIDLELDELTTAKEEIQSRLDENKEVLNRLVTDLEDQKEELEKIKSLRSQKQTESQEIQENLKEKKKRLLNVSSTKEYNAVEKEIETLQKSSEQLDEELLQLSEVIDSTESSIEGKELMTKELRESIAKEEAKAEEQLADLDAQIQALKNRTEEARDEVSKRVLHKYDFIRSRRPGHQAICAAKDGHCEGCFMALPPQLFIQIQRGETLETCPSCQRILYFWEDAIDEEIKTPDIEAEAGA